MLGLQTLSCLHDIPVVRSSTDKIQDVYSKAKDTSALIRLPCNLAETVADKSLKVALTVVNPLVKPFQGPVRAIDDYAAQKIRQIESKYPAINTPTEDVVNTFNEKTEPVRNVMNSVKDTTTSTLQQGKETVSNVAAATVHKASDVADTVYSFCETRVPGLQRRQTGKSTGSNGYVFSAIGSLVDRTFQSVQTSLVWVRMLLVFFLLKTKQTNDLVLNKIQHKPLTNVPQRVLIVAGSVLDYVIGRVRPDDRTLADLKKSKQQSRLNQQQTQQSSQYFFQRQSTKPEVQVPVTTRQSVVVTQQETVVTRTSNSALRSQPDYSNMTDEEELHARLAASVPRQSNYSVNDNVYTDNLVDPASQSDIAELHARINATDIELLHSRLPTDIIPTVDNDEPLSADQQALHARVIAAELERQGVDVDN